MASEDSRYRDRCLRFIDSVRSAMALRPASSRCAPCSIEWSTVRKSIEVESLRGSQWMLLEEGDHHTHQIGPTLHAEAQEPLTMVVVALLLDDRPAGEVLPEEPQRRSRRCGLRDRELVLDLPAQP